MRAREGTEREVAAGEPAADKLTRCIPGSSRRSGARQADRAEPLFKRFSVPSEWRAKDMGGGA